MQLKYVLVVPSNTNESDATLFQGWNPSVQNPNFLSLISTLSALPFSTDEIFLSQCELFAFRLNGVQRNVVSVGSKFLSELEFTTHEGIVVFLALQESLEMVIKYQIKQDKKALILSPSSDDAVIDIRNNSVAAHMLIDKAIFDLLPTSVRGANSLRLKYELSADFPKNHGINAPNLAVLRSLGYSIGDKPRENNDSFEEAEQLVVDSANLVSDRLREVGWPSPHLLLYCPSVKTFFYDFKNVAWNNLLRRMPEKWKRKILESTFRNPGYSEFFVKVDGPVTNPYSDEILGPILYMRQSELFATTMSIALMASNESLVSVRLPNILNLHGSRLRNLENLAKRSDAKAAKLIQREFRDYIAEMQSGIGAKIIEVINSGGASCKLCSDVPLEWLNLENLPLMIKREVSRTPMTPGNTVLQFASTGERIGFLEADLKKVLVVRSFSLNDPLLKVFENCLNEFGLVARLDITIIDVASFDQAKVALNAFQGHIVVFDCHGNHGGSTSYDWLQFGSEKVNTWNFAFQARVPPIILLSACLTSAIGGSHISVAAGLLRSGAHSVLGTFLPIDGPRSALFIARLLGRIDTYLPLARELGATIITWRSFVHGAMQLSYLSDVLSFFRYELKVVSEDAFEQAHLITFRNVVLGDPDWFDKALEVISLASAIPSDELLNRIVMDHPLMETMRYCQVGFPERIGIILADKLTEGR